MFLPSLKTIIEIRELSSVGMMSSRFGSEYHSEESGDEYDNIHKFTMEAMNIG
jgi:hypothetical protein